jgi:hypothetical protein
LSSMAANHFLSVLDFGSESVLVLVAKKEHRRIEVVGGGEAKAAGFHNGQLTSMTDAVEAVKEAVRKAERYCGFKIERLYYNYDDPQIECVAASGCKNLEADSPIHQDDTQETLSNAKRFILDYQKTVIHARDLYFVVDDKDRVSDPVGIYGRKLEVFMTALVCRAACLEAWENIFRRAFVAKSIAVPTILSVAEATVDMSAPPKIILWDLGNDYLNGCVLSGERIYDYRVFLTGQTQPEASVFSRVVQACGEFLKAHPGIGECVFTGDLCALDKWLSSVQKELSIPVTVRSPKGYDKLQKPAYASLVGLLLSAERREKKDPHLYRKQDLIFNFKKKTMMFINDYF